MVTEGTDVSKRLKLPDTVDTVCHLHVSATLVAIITEVRYKGTNVQM